MNMQDRCSFCSGPVDGSIYITINVQGKLPRDGSRVEHYHCRHSDDCWQKKQRAQLAELPKWALAA
jgi:hypothetical protein